MIKLKFSIYEHGLHINNSTGFVAALSSRPNHNAIWVFPSEDDLTLGKVGAGDAHYVTEQELPHFLTETQHALRFEVCLADNNSAAEFGGRLLSSETFNWPEPKAVFRLDQVTFPSGAIAYRHIHSGAGFRHLLLGGLQIDTGDHIEQMVSGDSWFEDIHSPVRATASDGCVSQFIRAMLIPVEFLGKPTIKILNPEDAAKPSLQKNHRFLDQLIEL